MNLTEYQKLSTRTMPFNGDAQNNQEFENMLGNYSMGIIGEMIEFAEIATTTQGNMESIKLEAGDVMHYAVGLLSLLGETADENKIPERVRGSSLFVYPGEIVEMAKKHIYHRHELDKEKMVELVYLTISNLKNVKEYEDWFQDVLRMNISKLKKRYPNKFNIQDSKKRVDTK